MIEVTDALRDAVLREALSGLTRTPKTLSPWLFYDACGSHLFDRITTLPEYYLTRTERALFTAHAAEIRNLIGEPVTIAELGAGSAGKTGILLREFATHQPGVLYQPVDVSASALDQAARSIAQHIPGVTVTSQVANYITERYNIERPRSGPAKADRVLALYIGSSIGNFSPDEAAAILAHLRGHLDHGDFFLLGVDLAPGEHKPVEALLAAYDDAAGVTASFDKNILARLNRELDANFNLEGFVHRARWNAAESRIEMHLESLADQLVTIDGTQIRFAAGETVHTENSYKFTAPAINALVRSAGFEPVRTFTDDGQRFAVVLSRAG